MTDKLVYALRQMINAVETGNIDSPEIQGEPENGIPSHRWHEEWVFHAKQALAAHEAAKAATQPKPQPENQWRIKVIEEMGLKHSIDHRGLHVIEGEGFRYDHIGLPNALRRIGYTLADRKRELDALKGQPTPDRQAAEKVLDKILAALGVTDCHPQSHALFTSYIAALTAPVPREVMETEFIEACQKSFIFSNVKAIMRLIKREYPDGVKLKGEA